jgi:protein-disulfide isomerase
MSIDGMRSRRAVLSTSAAALAALAGCTGGSGPDGGSGGNADSGTSLSDHPATGGVDGQPRLGPALADAPAVVVSFEDPSCSRCAAFERTTVPRLREHVDAGELAYVFRVYPVVYEWGKPAVQALEATYARDADAFWALASHYFETQSDFSTDNVLDRTESFLASETGLDAAAVVADAEAKAYDDAVQVDLDAGEAAGAGRTTPHLFLFRDGEYRSKASGSVSYDLIASALELR